MRHSERTPPDLLRNPGIAARPNWKGVLKIDEVACPVALFTAASTAERIAIHILDRKSGHRVHREYVDAETTSASGPPQKLIGRLNV